VDVANGEHAGPARFEEHRPLGVEFGQGVVTHVALSR
jgi:hypothetical protein